MHHRKHHSSTSASSGSLFVSVSLVVLGIITLGSIALLAAGFAVAQVTNDRLPINTAISGIDVSGMTSTDARTTVLRTIDEYSEQLLTFKSNAAAWLATSDQLGVHWYVDEAIARALEGHAASINDTSHLFQTTDIPMRVSYGEGVEQLIATIRASTDILAIDAALIVTGNGITISSERTGQVLDEQSFRDAIVSRASHLSTDPIAVDAVVDSPVMTAQDLIDAKLLAETMTSRPVVVTMDDQSWQIDTDTMASWITVTPSVVYDGRDTTTIPVVDIDEEAVSAFLTQIADEVDILPRTTTRIISEAHDGSFVEGSTGTVVDIPTAVAYLKDAALDRNDKSMALPIVTVPSEEEILSVPAPKPTGKVISVDVARQIAYAHEDGVLKNWVLVSTGRKGYDTPLGEWHVYSKTTIQSMSGPGYSLPGVKWVMAYNGDYTLHTAYWHNNFGTSMSHGCTNMREEDAKWFFDWADVGTPVIIFSTAE